MSGMNAKTGHAISGKEHIAQSIQNILITPVGSRLMRRSYGSLLPEMLDMPITDSLIMQMKAAVVLALTHWEPRISIQSLTIDISQGRCVLTLEAERADTGSAEKFELGLS